MISIDPEELSDEQFEAIVKTEGFQKMLLYRRLSEGMAAFQEHDELVDAMVRSITAQHSTVQSEETIREVLSILYTEVATFASPPAETPVTCAVDSTAGTDTPDADEPAPDDAERALREHLDDRLSETKTIEIQASEIASQLNLESTHVGGILGRWRKQEDGPFDIESTKSSSGSYLWTITGTSSADGVSQRDQTAPAVDE